MGKLSLYQRCLPTLVVIGCTSLLTLIWSATVQAQSTASDTVSAFNTTTKQIQTYRGKIVSYDYDELTLQLVSGREQSIASAQITDITSNWNTDHLAAEGYFFERRFERASISFRQAYAKETREWVKHRITAQLIQCEQNLGNWHTAATQFFDTLLSQQPNSPYLMAAPIAWHQISASGELLHRGRELLRADNSLKQLVGASWLLNSPYRSDAITLLKQLEQHTDPSIVLLAKAQSWRIQIPTAKAADVQYWDQAIQQMPKTLRAGPLYVVAQMKRNLDRNEEAALTFMRIPILYPSQHHLSAEATYAAIRELMKLTHYSEALSLCKEMGSHYGDTVTGTQVERLEKDIQARINARNRIKMEGDSS